MNFVGECVSKKLSCYWMEWQIQWYKTAAFVPWNLVLIRSKGYVMTVAMELAIPPASAFALEVSSLAGLFSF